MRARSRPARALAEEEGGLQEVDAALVGGSGGRAGGGGGGAGAGEDVLCIFESSHSLHIW